MKRLRTVRDKRIIQLYLKKKKWDFPLKILATNSAENVK